ncbi:hypothetical protein Tco_0807618 [Tanacetum coccineum]
MSQQLNADADHAGVDIQEKEYVGKAEYIAHVWKPGGTKPLIAITSTKDMDLTSKNSSVFDNKSGYCFLLL